MRTRTLPCLPLLAILLAACVHAPVRAQETSPAGEEAKEPSVQYPWKVKVIADTIEDLSDPDWNIRSAAIRKVVGAGRWIVPFLLVAVKNPEPLNRMEVAYCLGRIGDRSAVPTLLETLDSDPPFGVLTYFADALGRLGDTTAVEPLKEYLHYTLEREEYGRTIGPFELKVIESREGTVRHAVAEALILLGDKDGMPVLIDGLTLNGWLRRDASVRLRRLTGCKVDFGFHLDVPDTEKKTIQDRWKAWWEENKEGFVPVKGPSRDAFDVYMPRDKQDKGLEGEKEGEGDKPDKESEGEKGGEGG